MKIADMPVGTKYSSGQHEWVKISADLIRSTKYASLVLIMNCPGDRKVIADPIVECGDICNIPHFGPVKIVRISDGKVWPDCGGIPCSIHEVKIIEKAAKK